MTMGRLGGLARGLGVMPAPPALLLITCLALLGALALPGASTEGTAPPPPMVVPVTLYRRVRSWGDYAEPLAVLRLGQAAGALHYVPGLRDGSPPRLLAVGDAAGALLLLSPGGRLLAQHPTGTASPVTAVGSYRLGRNATVLLTGHRSGELRLHLLQHPPALAAGSRGGGGGGGSWEEAEEEWEGAREEQGEGSGGAPLPLSLSLLEAFPPEALLCRCSSRGTGLLAGTCSAGAAGAEPQAGATVGPAVGAAGSAAAPGPSCPRIVAVHGFGRGGTVAAIAVVVDAAGGLAVLKQGGPAGAGVRIVRQAALAQQPVAVRPQGGAAGLLGSSGMATQRLASAPVPKHSGTEGPQAAGAAAGAAPGSRESAPCFDSPAFRPCQSLNGSSIVAAAFDAVHTTRAYALTDDGRVLSIMVGAADRTSAAGCVVRAAAPLPAGLRPTTALPAASQAGANAEGVSSCGGGGGGASAGSARLAVATLPGYLLVTAGDRLALFNVSATLRQPPRLLLQQPLVPLLARFVPQEEKQEGQEAEQQQSQQQQQGAGAEAEAELRRRPALLAASHAHVAVMLNSTVLALYHAALPFRPPPQPYKGGLAWLQIVQPAALVLVAAMVLFRARSKRGGGGGGGGGRFTADARLREFERLLQDPLAGAVGPRRHRPLPGGGWHAGGSAGGSSSGGSDVEDSLLGTLTRGGARLDAAAGAAATKPRRPGLFGSRGAGSEGSSKGREAQRQRAAALAASDDRETAAMRAELAGAGVAAGGAGAGSSGDESDDEREQQSWEFMRGGAAGAGAGAAPGDDVSQLRRRLNQASID